MGVVVGEGEAEEQGVGAEIFFEVVDDGDGAAFAHQDRFVTEGGLQRAQRRFCLRAGGRNQVRLGTVAGIDYKAAGWRAILEEELSRRVDDLARILVRDEAHGDLRTRPERGQ